MRVPVIWGVIDRRILVNFRVEPDVLRAILPTPFRPKLVRAWGIAGVCLIRLNDIRPRLMPASLGLSSENAAHRIAVEWEEDGVLKEGVYIPRRDTSSPLNTVLGGRFFPGVHHRADFQVVETGDFYHVELRSHDRVTKLVVEGRIGASLPASSVFSSLAEASTFFERGALGYSPAEDGERLEGLELRTLEWDMVPLDVSCVESSFFDDVTRFPPGSTLFDCALLMRRIQHEWHARDSIG